MIAIFPVLLHPKSKGQVRLRNNDPLSRPLIYPGYMAHPQDRAVQIEAIKFALRLVKTEALKKYVVVKNMLEKKVVMKKEDRSKKKSSNKK